MRTMTKGLFLLCVLAALTGCGGVTGKWTMQSINPETEKEHFNLQCMCLMDDGTFMACATVKDKTEKLTGTYEFDQKAEKLTFKEKGGKTYTYSAKLVGLGGEMKVWGGEKGKEWTAMMKHAGACEKGKCCPANCDPKTCDPKKCQPAKTADAPKAQPEKKAPPKGVEAKKPAAPKPGDNK
jgi:hypothetical protein